jgi:hypothetical protein
MARGVGVHGVDLPLFVIGRGDKEKGRQGEFDFSPLPLVSPSPLLVLKLSLRQTPFFVTLEQEACYV